ncbi:MAG: hypothetical protein ACRENP_21685 [Longimicrobiales bacterium]
MTELTDFLFPAPAPRSTPGIWQWWEARRLKYNALVGGAGLVSLGVIRTVTWLPPNRHEEMLPLAVVVVFGVMANVCYTLGPTVEVISEKLWGRKILPVGPTLFRMGLSFSIGLALLPSLIAGFDWGFRILKALF